MVGKINVTEESDTLPLISEIITIATLGLGIDTIEAQTLTAPCDIKGLSIIDHPYVSNFSEASQAYRI